MQIHSPEILFFLQICSYKSFSQAAEHMNVPQPTVSRRILALENTLQRPLFIRSKSGLQLTAFGEEFRQNALRVQKELDNLKSLATNTVHTPTVKVEAQPALSKHFLNSILPEFQKEYPKINVDLSDISYESLSIPSDAIRLHTFVPENLDRVNFAYLESTYGYYVSNTLRSDLPDLCSAEDLSKNNVPIINIRGDRYQQELASRLPIPSLFVDNALNSAEAVVNNMGVSLNYDVVMQPYIIREQAHKLFENENSRNAHAYISYPLNKQLSVEEDALIDFVRAQQHLKISA